MIVPFVDLRRQYQDNKVAIDAAIANVIEKTAFIGGDDHVAFEREFAQYCDAQACALVGNGTDAIYLALRALGVGQGDQVITVSHTFIGSVEPITMTGAEPVFVDICSDTMLMDPQGIEAAITPRTKAIVPVHLYGQPCDMDAISAIADKYRLKVVEDAAQAHGARWANTRIGTFGDAACFSFYPGKNLGAYGDGGAVVSNDEDFIRKVRMLSNHGRTEKYAHEIEGVNSRLDGMQAAILRVKLRHLDQWNDLRRRHADQYVKELADCEGVVLPVVRNDAESVWHLFVVRVNDREKLKNALQKQEISCGIHYPIPLHLQSAYARMTLAEGSLRNSERVASEILSLPMYPELTDEMVSCVTNAVRCHVGG